MSIFRLNTLSDRLCYALSKLGTSQAELARRINVKRQAIQYLCASGINKSKFAYHIAEALAINAEWLITGRGNMVVKNSPEQLFLARQHSVPVLQWQQIDSWSQARLHRHTMTEWTNTYDKLSDHAYAIRLKDNAMAPRFDSNTIVVLDPDVDAAAPCFVIAYIDQLKDHIFRQLHKENNALWLLAYNDVAYKKLPLSPADKILACLVEARWLAREPVTDYA